MTAAAIQERMTVAPEEVRKLDNLVTGAASASGADRETPVVRVDPESEADAPVFALPEAIQFALANSPRLKMARENIARARGQEEMAFAPFLPEVGLVSRWGATSSNLSPGSVNITGGLLASGTNARQFSQGELQLQWTIWDFGRRAGQYGQAVSRERIAELQRTRARQTVAYDVTAAYLEVLLAQVSRRVQEQSIRSAETILRDTRVRRKSGVADLDTVMRAEVQLSEARAARVGARQAEFDALARLNFNMGRNARLPRRLVDWKSRPSFRRSLVECLQTIAATATRSARATACDWLSGMCVPCGAAGGNPA